MNSLTDIISNVENDNIFVGRMPYKECTEIKSSIVPTAKIIDQLVPVYNFKAE